MSLLLSLPIFTLWQHFQINIEFYRPVLVPNVRCDWTTTLATSFRLLWLSGAAISWCQKGSTVVIHWLGQAPKHCWLITSNSVRTLSV